MLVLSRNIDQQIMIGKDVVLTVLEIRGDRVRLGITAPADTPVHRSEVWRRIEGERRIGIATAMDGNSNLCSEYV